MSGAFAIRGRAATVGVRLLIVLAYLARPWSCVEALGLEPRVADDPYARSDPHGFGLMGAMFSALVFIVPVLWLLLQRRPAAAGAVEPARVWRRSAAVLLVVGTPMLMQVPYFWLPLGYGWPVVASSAAWFVLVAALCFYGGQTLPSVHAAFDRSPRIAWGVVAVIAAAKLSPFALVYTG